MGQRGRRVRKMPVVFTLLYNYANVGQLYTWGPPSSLDFSILSRRKTRRCAWSRWMISKLIYCLLNTVTFSTCSQSFRRFVFYLINWLFDMSDFICSWSERKEMRIFTSDILIKYSVIVWLWYKRARPGCGCRLSSAVRRNL